MAYPPNSKGRYTRIFTFLRLMTYERVAALKGQVLVNASQSRKSILINPSLLQSTHFKFFWIISNSKVQKHSSKSFFLSFEKLSSSQTKKNTPNMAPAATFQTNHTDGTTNGTTLKATAPSFHPTGTPDPSKYHASSTDEAIQSEHTHAAHNYHPLPIVFSRAAGCSVWDPEGKE